LLTTEVKDHLCPYEAQNDTNSWLESTLPTAISNKEIIDKYMDMFTIDHA
jgi:hypothetical protein